jgi:menaquinol-cytochrome c reductase iron-sulfur subunit
MSHSPGSEPFTAPVAPGRRTFFQRVARWVTVGLGTAATLALSIPLVDYLLGPVTKKRPEKWVNLGPVGKFPPNQTRLATFDNPIRQPWDGVTAQTGVYVRHRGGGQPPPEQFWVFAINCAHLGCPVSWFPQSGLFLCPCHGGVYYENGEHASGPPPRGLFHCDWKVLDGELWVRAPHYPTLHDTLTGEEGT